MTVATSTTPPLSAEIGELLAGRRLDDPFPVWNRLRSEGPILSIPGGVIVSRHADVKRVFSDMERLSAQFFVTGSRAEQAVAGFSDEGQRMWRVMAEKERKSITRSDGDDHARLRRIAHRYFTPRRISALRSYARTTLDELLGQVPEDEPWDFCWLARELPLLVMAEVIGTRKEDRADIFAWSSAIALHLGTRDEGVLRNAYEARMTFDAYVEEVVLPDHRRNAGANALVAALMDATDNETLRPDELAAMIYILLFAGSKTTTTLLGTGLCELLVRREQWERLCGERNLLSGAVEELLRFVTPVQFVNRVAVAPMREDGLVVAAGETVIGATAAANRDPAVFDDPDALDIARDRRQTSSHLSLGFGPHYCLGASLARMEAEIVFGTLASRYPDIQLAVDPSDLTWAGSNPMLRALRALPVRSGPKRD
jgi:cytochrome P450